MQPRPLCCGVLWQPSAAATTTALNGTRNSSPDTCQGADPTTETQAANQRAAARKSPPKPNKPMDSSERMIFSPTFLARHREIAILIYIALATIVCHLLTGGRYGFHRDELATLDDARHLAWGYVAYPPVTPFFGRLALLLFGTSLRGFRFFAAASVSVAVVLTGLMARELGGRTGAQALAASAAIPFALGTGSLMQYVAFDYLAWVACSYFFVRLCKSRDPRWWLAIGAASVSAC